MMNKIYNEVNSLYVHIPFCNRICPYCDFPKMVATDELKENYVKALMREFEIKKVDNYPLQTLYFGGGTPSSLSISLLNQLLSYFDNHLNFDNIKEFSFECNVEDINEDLLKLLKNKHVNRLSIGVQTFNDEYQSLINRIYSYDYVKNKIDLVKKYFNNFSIDLMYGFVDETIEILKNDIDKIISFKPPHISLYCLSIEPHSIFGINKKQIYNCSEDNQKDQYYFIKDYLMKHNYFHYEISNYSLKGYESIHNLTYWKSNSYECLGAGGSSFINGVHMTNPFKIHNYIKCLNENSLKFIERDLEDSDNLIDEFIMMNLRLIKGFLLKDFSNRFNIELNEYYNLKPLLDEELLIKNDDMIFINPKYLFVSNYVIVKLISTHEE